MVKQKLVNLLTLTHISEEHRTHRCILHWQKSLKKLSWGVRPAHAQACTHTRARARNLSLHILTMHENFYKFLDDFRLKIRSHHASELKSSADFCIQCASGDALSIWGALGRKDARKYNKRLQKKKKMLSKHKQVLPPFQQINTQGSEVKNPNFYL